MSLKEAVKNLLIKGIFGDKEIDDFLREIQRELIKGDVDVKVVFELSKKIKERIKKEWDKSLSKKDLVLKATIEELINILGREAKIEVNKKPFKILLLGLYGSGKTTTAGKLAKYFKKKGYKVCLVSLDEERPAAYEQLKQLSEKVGARFGEGKTIEERIKNSKGEILIFDTVGTESVDKIKKYIDLINPDLKLLVLSGEIGQMAKKYIEEFKKVNIEGVILTKMDSSAKGGAALTACYLTNAPVYFLGTGEKLDDLEEWDAERYVKRLLGFGDIKYLLERAREVKIKEEDLKDFNMIFFYNQIESLEKMGPLQKIFESIPGFSFLKIPKDVLNIQKEKIKKYKAIIQSLKKKELYKPELIRGERIEKIAYGSGTDVKTVKELLDFYRKMRKIFKGGNIKRYMKMLKKMGINYEMFNM